MALGDGSAWDETVPTDATLVAQIDDYDRDLRIGVRSRMAFEHEWPASQSATAGGGKHKYITLQNQSTKPTISGTQVGAVYQKSSALYFEDSAGVEIQITTGTALNAVLLSSINTQLPKAIISFSGGLSGTNAPVFGFNCTNVSKTATGDYLVILNTAFANTAGMVTQITVQETAGSQFLIGNLYPTTPLTITSVRVTVANVNNNVLNDSPLINVTVWGSQ